jgi:proteasome accessory factor A
MSKPSHLSALFTERAPKLCGADYEFQNFITNVSRIEGTGYEASRLLLRQIDGFTGDAPSSGGSAVSSSNSGSTTKSAYYSQDFGRKFLPNGMCFYVDLNHLEGCIAEVTNAYDHVASCHALFHHAHLATKRANEDLPDEHKVVVLANNSDGQGNSFGTHLNFLVTRREWENIFHRKPLHQLVLASFQASLQVITGQGKVGAENNQETVDYQLSQRADHMEIICGLQTTYNRPIVNSRDEAHCGEWRAPAQDPAAANLARLHCIFFDNNLCHVAAFLKVGAMQIFLAMLEAGRLNPSLILDDAVAAVVDWSHDPSLKAKARLANDEEITIVDLQRRFFDEAARFVSEGGCEGFVPHAAEIIELWGDTLEKLARRDFAALAPRLDWVLKKMILEDAMRRKAGLNWQSPQIKYLDHQYANLDPKQGLYWAYERSGFVQRLVNEGRIARFAQSPPEDTRAWTRGALLALAGADDIDNVDWDSVRFRIKDDTHWLPRYRTVRLANPLGHTKAQTSPLLPETGRLEDVLDALDAREEERRSYAVTTTNRDEPGDEPPARARYTRDN